MKFILQNKPFSELRIHVKFLCGRDVNSDWLNERNATYTTRSNLTQYSDSFFHYIPGQFCKEESNLQDGDVTSASVANIIQLLNVSSNLWTFTPFKGHHT
jgi:hypothetical protein